MNSIRRILAGSSLGLAVAVGTGLADDPSRPSSAVRAEIERLVDRDFRTREAATRELIRLDAAALTAIRALADSDDPDLNQRARRIVRGIERQRLVREFATTPTIRLQFADVPLQVALHDVERLTGVRLHEGPGDIADNRRRITVDTGDRPFWDAIGRFLDDCQLSAEPALGTTAVSPAPPIFALASPLGQGLPSPVAFPTASLSTHATIRIGDRAVGRSSFGTAGPVLVRPVSVRHPGSRRSADGSTSIPLEVLRCGTLATSEIEDIHIDRAIDDRGRHLQTVPAPLEEASESQSLFFPVPNPPPLGIAISIPGPEPLRVAANPLMTVHLQTGPHSSRRLAILEGTVRLRVSAVQSIAEVALSTETRPRFLGCVGERSLELVEVTRPSPDILRVEVRATVGRTKELELPIAFRDGSDNPIEPTNEWRREIVRDGGTIRSYRFDLPVKLGEVRLHVRELVSGTIALPFSLRDLDLP